MEGYMTVKEASMKWGVSERHVQAICKNGLVDGVARLGRNWLIPEDAEKPLDKRLTTGEYKNWRKQYENIKIEDVW